MKDEDGTKETWGRELTAARDAVAKCNLHSAGVQEGGFCWESISFFILEE